MAKVDVTNIELVGNMTTAELLALEEKLQKEEDALIDKNLNDPKFLNFLQKCPDAVDRSHDNEYIKEKVAVFENVQKVKKNVEKYLKEGTGLDSATKFDDPFFEKIEQISINDPSSFLDFSEKVSKYLESLEKNKKEEAEYRAVSKTLRNEDIDFSGMKDSEKRDFIENFHSTIEQTKDKNEGDLDSFKKTRGFNTYFSTKARQEFISKRDEIVKNIESLKKGEEKLNKESILATINELEGIKNALKGNDAFTLVAKEFEKKQAERVGVSMFLKKDSELFKQVEALRKMKANQSILEEGECDAIAENIRSYSREKLSSNTAEMVDKKEAVTLNVFEKGINKMREDGLKLGLSEEECNDEIKSALEKKITELNTNPDQDQNRIKLILAKRVLSKIE